jgi:hypothetical protein
VPHTALKDLTCVRDCHAAESCRRKRASVAARKAAAGFRCSARKHMKIRGLTEKNRRSSEVIGPNMPRRT